MGKILWLLWIFAVSFLITPILAVAMLAFGIANVIAGILLLDMQTIMLTKERMLKVWRIG